MNKLGALNLARRATSLPFAVLKKGTGFSVGDWGCWGRASTSKPGQAGARQDRGDLVWWVECWQLEESSWPWLCPEVCGPAQRAATGPKGRGQAVCVTGSRPRNANNSLARKESQPTGGPRRSLIRLIRPPRNLEGVEKYIAGQSQSDSPRAAAHRRYRPLTMRNRGCTGVDMELWQTRG